jgi:uncharacterized caspase-like protein
MRDPRGQQDDETAYEDSALHHGVFTHYLLKALTDGSVNQPWIGLNALYERVADQVHSFTQGRQNPVLNGRLGRARLPMLTENRN